MEDMTLRIEFFGQIETTAAFKDLVKVIANLDEYEGDENSARQALVDANLEGEGFEIEESCYNYRSDTVNEIIKVAKKHKIDLVTTLTEGGMSNPGTIRFVRDGHASFELPTMDGKVSVNSDVIAKLKSRGMTTLDELDTFLDYFKVEDQPKFTVADEVIADIFLPKRNK